MFDGMLILRIPSTSLVEKTHLEKMHAILNPMTNSYKKKKPSLYGRISSTSTILFLLLPQPPVADGC